MPLTAQVAVSDATIYYDKLYTYLVPAPLEGHLFVGSVVLVPFGRGRAKPRIGVVLELEQAKQVDGRVKELLDVAPEEARLTGELLAIVKHLKEVTFCTWFEAVRAVIPHGAQYKPVHTTEGWALKRRISRHSETVYLPAEPAPQGKKPTTKQQQVLDYVADEPHTRAEIMAACGVGRTVTDTLVKNGWLATKQRELDSGLWNEEPAQISKGLETSELALKGTALLPCLSEAQRQVVEPLQLRMGEAAPKPAMLYGVTGSGKSLVFIELVRAALQSGKTALVLVPEIGLTPQMIDRLRHAFGGQVAVQHSALSDTQRLLQWRQIRHGEAKVVVGTRSAIFAPLDNIGLIVVDEEQERTYQSESAPRYDALDIARRRATRHGALLLLASATPAVADFYAAQQGKYELLFLKERYGNLPLPAVEMVDMRDQLLAGNTGAVSARLMAEMAQNLAEGRQTILLLNRRGYHRVGVCRSCREAIKCGECSVPMVYHRGKGGKRGEVVHSDGGETQVQQGDRLMCHYCGHVQSPPPDKCPSCGGEIRYAGFGTQRLEEELAEKLPNARLLRMDLDSTGRRGAHGDMLARFAKGEYDILLGTQMVAKGLDFERVSLVGVIGIDSLLFSQGYRAYENVFSLVTQVVGRSGRAGSPGRALIQTVDVENPVLTLAAQQDYQAFYRQEIAFRKLALYPPFCTLCVVGFAAQAEADALAAARRFSAMLAGFAAQQPDLPLRILGPAPMNLSQLGGSYRYRLTLKCRGDAAFRALMRQTLDSYNKEGWPKKATAWLDFYNTDVY